MTALPRWGTWTQLQRGLVILHGFIVLSIVLGLAAGGAFWLRTVNNYPWYSPTLESIFLAATAVVFIAGLLIYRRTRAGLIGATAVIMLMTNAFFLWGYKDSFSGRSQGLVLVSQILDRYPNAEIYNAAPGVRNLLPLEMLIYLNRNVPTLADPATLAPSDKPQVLMYPPSKADPYGTPPTPAGFHPLAQVKVNTGYYTVLVRDPVRDGVRDER